MIVSSSALKLAYNRLRAIRELMGNIQDGSDTTVKFYQDDATRSYFVEVGKRSYYGDTFEEALDKAIDDNQE